MDLLSNKMAIFFEKQDKMLDKQDKMLDKQDKMLDKQASDLERDREERKRSDILFKNNMETYGKDIRRSTTELSQEIKRFTKNLDNYISIEADIIEEETNEQLKKFFTLFDKYASCYIYDITKDWKFLKVPTKNAKNDPYINKEDITEFDGLYIISPYEIKYVGHELKRGTPQASRQQLTKHFFVVLESKHKLTNDKINDKITKLKLFQAYLANSSNTEYVKNATKEYQTKVEQYQLAKASSQIELYIGGPYVVKTISDHIHTNSDTWATDKVIVNYLKPDGERYSVFHKSNKYTPISILETSVRRKRHKR